MQAAKMEESAADGCSCCDLVKYCHTASGVISILCSQGCCSDGRQDPHLCILQVDKVNALEPSMQQLSDDALRGKTAEFKSRVQRGERLDDLLIEAFGVTEK